MKRLITLAAAAAMLSASAAPVFTQESPTQAEDPYLLKKGEKKQAPKVQGEAPARSETQTQNPDQPKPPAAAETQQPAPEGKKQNNAQTEQQPSPDGTKQNNAQTEQQQDPNKKPAQSAEQPGVSKETTASVNITTEQKTEIREVIVREAKPVDVDFQINVGVAVPRTVVLHRLPVRVVKILPQYEGYEYFVLADGRIIIVEPGTLEIVYVLVV